MRGKGTLQSTPRPPRPASLQRLDQTGLIRRSIPPSTYHGQLTGESQTGAARSQSVHETKIWEFTAADIKEYVITPGEMGLPESEVDDIRSSSRESM
jgi:hypothetical protein